MYLPHDGNVWMSDEKEEFLTVLLNMSRRFRSVQNSESKNTHYQIDKNEFQRWLDMTESAKIKLYKNMVFFFSFSELRISKHAFCFKDNEQQNEESMNEPSLLEHKYSNKSDKTCDILDICSGNLNHINIKQVVSFSISPLILIDILIRKFKVSTRVRDGRLVQKAN